MSHRCLIHNIYNISEENCTIWAIVMTGLRENVRNMKIVTIVVMLYYAQSCQTNQRIRHLLHGLLWECQGNFSRIWELWLRDLFVEEEKKRAFRPDYWLKATYTSFITELKCLRQILQILLGLLPINLGTQYIYSKYLRNRNINIY